MLLLHMCTDSSVYISDDCLDERGSIVLMVRECTIYNVDIHVHKHVHVHAHVGIVPVLFSMCSVHVRH